jgi:hypothetical protein
LRCVALQERASVVAPMFLLHAAHLHPPAFVMGIAFYMLGVANEKAIC